MRSLKLNIAIVGGGLGGLAAASLLEQAGFEVTVYEQAKSFSRIGAGIHLGPNLVKLLKRIGIAERVRAMGVRRLALGLDFVLAEAHRQLRSVRWVIEHVLGAASAGSDQHRREQQEGRR